MDKETLLFMYKSKKLYTEYNFSYYKTKYINSRTNLIITCPIHGDFPINPNNHLNNNRSCKKCNIEKRIKKESNNFIFKSKKIHNNKYNYDNVNYINSKKSVNITCPIHGDFPQSPNSHLNGRGCPKCQKNYKLTNNSFQNKANKIHNFKYKYNNDYIDSSTPINITCPIHGKFPQRPYSHLNGHGCPKCSNKKNGKNKRHDLDKLIQKFNLIHDFKYKYDLTDYESISKNITIICPIHDKFNQIGSHHLKGHGCPKCNQSKGELKIEKLLKENNIEFNYQHKFEKCINKRQLPFDFYLPNFNTCIEFDGKQHFEVFEKFGKESFERTQKHDKIKNKYCKENNIKLIRIKYSDTNKTILNKLKHILEHR
jgi:very-short-patch-repair endonuclease